MKRYMVEQSDKEFYTTHAGLALVGPCLNRFTSFSEKVSDAVRQEGGIPHVDILRSYVGLLAMGKSDFEAIEPMRQDDHFRVGLGCSAVPSAVTLRQQMDEHASEFLPAVNDCAVEVIRRTNGKISALPTRHIPLDIDVFPMDNSGTKKEGVGRTYHNYDGYAPIAAYLGMEGWCLEIELRPGSQHSQNGFIPFLERVIAKARTLTSAALLMRLDSAHDALENRAVIRDQEKVSSIIKWNPRGEDAKKWLAKGLVKGKVSEPRPGKRVVVFTVRVCQNYKGKKMIFTRVMRVIERTIDKRGQRLLVPEITLEGWWTSLALPAEEVIRLYENHGLCEQFHSEFKTDMDLERLPSGKFATNALVLSLAVLAYNILRLLGQEGLLRADAPSRKPAKRRRIKTVIQELIYLAARVISKGRRLWLRFSRHCPAFAVFKDLYAQFALS